MNEAEAYELFDLSRDASREDVERAYRKKQKKDHPDKNPEREEWATKQTKENIAAYETIIKALEKPKSHQRTEHWESQKQSSPPEQRAREQRAQEQKAARNQQVEHQQGREHARRQAWEQFAAKKRAAQIRKARKNGTLTELLWSWGEHIPGKEHEEWARYVEWSQRQDGEQFHRKKCRTPKGSAGDTKQTPSTKNASHKRNNGPEPRQTKETSGLQRFGEFIRFLIDEFIFFCLGG